MDEKKTVTTKFGDLELSVQSYDGKENLCLNFEEIVINGVAYKGTEYLKPDCGTYAHDRFMEGKGWAWGGNGYIRRHVATANGDIYPTSKGRSIIYDLLREVATQEQEWIESQWLNCRTRSMKYRLSRLQEIQKELEDKIKSVSKQMENPSSTYTLKRGRGYSSPAIIESVTYDELVKAVEAQNYVLSAYGLIGLQDEFWLQSQDEHVLYEDKQYNKLRVIIHRWKDDSNGRTRF